MNDQNITPTEPTAAEVAVTSPGRRRNLSLLIACIAVFLAFCIVTSFLIADVVKANRPETPAPEDLPFNYTELNLKDYFADFSADDVTGYKIPGKEYSVEEVDEEYVIDYINYLFRAAATTPDAVGNRSNPVDYADELSLYVLSVKLDGKEVGEDFFVNAYIQANSIFIGDETFGEDFDDKLIGLVPADSYYTHRTNVAVTADSVITLTYSATIDGEEKAYESYSNLRIDLSTAEDYIVTPLLAASPIIGQKFDFTAVYDIDDDGEDETVQYEAYINSVVEETPIIITATLPDDYFPDTMDEKYVSLNGKALEFALIIEYSNSYSAKKYDEITKDDIKAMVNANGLAFTVKDDDDDATVKKALFDFVMEERKATLNETLESNKLNLIWNAILDEMTFSVPEEARVKAASSLRAQLQQTYLSYANMYGNDFLSDCPTLEVFARDYYFVYEEEDYASYNEYIDEYYSVRYARQQMLLYGIFEHCGLTIDEKAFEAEYKSTMKSQAEYMGSTDKPASEKEVNKYFIEQYGADLATLIRSNYISEAVNAYLIEHNEIDFETAAEPK